VDETLTEQETQAPPALPLAPPEFAALYETHSRAIYYLALRYLGQPSRAEDATHDVFLKAYRKWSEFRGDASARTWLYRIAINHCHNLRQSWASRNLVTNADEAVWENAAAPIQDALDGLSAEYRLLLLLVADQEMSYDEVASLTGQTADAVRGKLHRARKAFALLFAKTEKGSHETENQTHPG
jgi:RNA polymerase sigma-70 factor (ECF subfamily)